MTVAPEKTRYSLAEASILFQPWLSDSTLTEALVRPTITTTSVEPWEASLHKIVIRRLGPELSTRGPIPSTLLSTARRVLQLLNLPTGWNSHAAKPIAHQTALDAIRLIAGFVGPDTPGATVVPTVRGGIQLEWHVRGTNIEIYIEATGAVSFFAEDTESGRTVEAAFRGHEDELRLWLQRLSGK